MLLIIYLRFNAGKDRPLKECKEFGGEEIFFMQCQIFGLENDDKISKIVTLLL